MLLYFKRIHIIDELIRNESTGNSKALAKKVGISRSSLFEYLDTMKELGAPIEYHKTKGFYYTESGHFNFFLHTKSIS